MEVAGSDSATIEAGRLRGVGILPQAKSRRKKRQNNNETSNGGMSQFPKISL
jgi:hypothetical protein